MKICGCIPDGVGYSFCLLVLSLPIVACQLDFSNLIYDKYGVDDGVTQQLSSENLTMLINNVLDGRYYNNETTEVGDEDSTSEQICHSPIPFDTTSSLPMAEFHTFCPKILYSLTQNCTKSEERSQHESDLEIETKPSAGAVWGYGLLFVTLINLLSLVGIVVLPLMKKSFYSTLLMFLIALAVGTLTASGGINLIPGAFEIKEQEGFRWKAAVIMGGVYLFFLTERILKMVLESITKRKAGEEHHQPSAVAETSTEHRAGKMQQEGDEGEPTQEKKQVAPVAWMIIFGDAFHNFIDGLSIGAAFSDSILLGISVSLAVVCEELPHELGDFAVLLNAGMSKKKALLFNFLSACTCYLGFIIGVSLSQASNAKPWIMGIAGGMFLYIALADMMPEMNQAAEEHKDQPIRVFLIQNAGLLIGFAIILLISTFEDGIRV